MLPNQCKYPITSDQLKNLKPCRLVNPKEGKHYNYRIPEDFDINEKAQEIVKVVKEVKSGKFPYWFMEKYYPFKSEFGSYKFPAEVFAVQGLSEYDPNSLADVVHMDSPTDMPRMVLKWLTHPDFRQKANVKNWTPNYINFLETIPYVEEQISDGVKRALNKAFNMKYYFGLARPEEVIGSNITTYPEGCPNHPSFPAGHSAAAAGGIVYLLREFPGLNSVQLKKVLDTAYSWGMFRSFAGVHYAEDNIMGLMSNGFEKYMSKEVIKLYKK